jgi:YidC/Oxa1 family membrane protein insertase
MERRLFSAIPLCFRVLYGSLAPSVPGPPETGPPAPATAGPAVAAPPAAGTAAPVAAGPAAEPVVAAEAESRIVVETATVEAVLTNRGGRLVRWGLKDYPDLNGDAVDLVPSEVPADQPQPFSLVTDDPALTARLNDALYTASAANRVDARTEARTVTFEYEDSTGLRVTKSFTFEPSGYVMTFSATATEAGRTLNPAIAWGPGLGDEAAATGGGSFFTGNRTQPPEAFYYLDGDIERERAGGLGSTPTYDGDFRYAGIDDHYFVAAALDVGRARLEFHPLPLPGPGETTRAFITQSIQPAEPLTDLRFYLGPKQFDLLQAVDPELVRVINFGIFGWLSIWLLDALKWIHGFAGNWGWSIVWLTILLNLIIAPLRHKSVVSMRKMQAIQPQLKAIQDHYAGLKVTDPARQKMNTEIMALYREKGVNPASGCLPMIAMMPILLAFYSLLSQAIELRGAPFTLWITDLSVRDPYFVTPLLMTASMFWQQRITPSTADPTQQRIMMIMPLMFGVMFLWVPSGLVLYWFTGNLCGIGQQYFTNWMIGPPQVAPARPPAERRVKNAGGGRTEAASRKRS